MLASGTGTICFALHCLLNPTPLNSPFSFAHWQVWDAACAADSQLLAPATASKLAAEDAGAAAEAAAVLLTQASRKLVVEG